MEQLHGQDQLLRPLPMLEEAPEIRRGALLCERAPDLHAEDPMQQVGWERPLAAPWKRPSVNVDGTKLGGRKV